MPVRDIYISRLKTDLMGPLNENKNEVIDFSSEGPDKEYFTGKLYPKNSEASEDAIEEIIEETNSKENQSAQDESINKFDRPSSFGITFALEAKKNTQIEIIYEFGKYYGEKITENEKNLIIWRRKHFCNDDNPIVFNVPNENSSGDIENGFIDALNLSFSFKCKRIDAELLSLSIFAVNENSFSSSQSYIEKTQDIIFQSKFTVKSINSEIIPLPKKLTTHKSDELNSFLFRDQNCYAVGHTCSADWKILNNKCNEIHTEWIPSHFIPDMSAAGHSSIKELDLSAKNIISNGKNENISLLNKFIDLYEEWIERESNCKFTKEEIELNFNSICKEQSNKAKYIASRMRDSVIFLENSEIAYDAFVLANKALSFQYSWNSIDLAWRPFQLGFVLLSLESTLDQESDYRNEVDLLWFPTGGGKTEAYLFLSSVLLFYRKLELGSLNEKDGLAIFTRYTLRGLTLDQFKRLASTVLACEVIRRKELKRANDTPHEESSFSLGMWVGESATPNTIQAAENEDSFQQGDYRILKKCPCCDQKLHYEGRAKSFFPSVNDENNLCRISQELKLFPIQAIDELIYKNPPSIIIGTVDKFVQVIRKPVESRALFAFSKKWRGPDLIIQDELHLISGPLGSISGLVEMLIDFYSSRRNMASPKIISSTATIQRADEQILGLYAKKSVQFPVNISVNNDSFFSQTDTNSPGRIYLGITSASAPSAIYLLQAISAILLQCKNSKELENYALDDIDPYTTQVTYFNTLRILGGARVILQDDTPSAMESYAARYKESVLQGINLEELTSNSTQEELDSTLERLNLNFSEDGHISVLLASVMISVGLDISRLGLMVVDGQPKSIAEYIQATSRVGRGKVPGLVINILNEFKPRDKSYFETFKIWHQSLYRYVESTGVTPMSPRARLKILPALVVSIGLILRNDNQEEFKFNLPIDLKDKISEEIKSFILNKVEITDSAVLGSVEDEIDQIIFKWINRGDTIPSIWNDYDELNSLFISAEFAASKSANNIENSHAFVAPNSAREVEPDVKVSVRNIVNSADLADETIHFPKKLPSIRRSQPIFLYGPGAIVNLKDGKSSVSAIMCELQSWEYKKTASTQSTRFQRFTDGRLSKSLESEHGIKVTDFRLPPVEVNDRYQRSEFQANLVAKTFPEWLLCPACRKVKFITNWESDRGQRGNKLRICASCTAESGRKTYPVASRFIRVCKKGHLDDFNYSQWLRFKNNQNPNINESQKQCNHDHLILRQAKGLGLSSLILKCLECDSFTDMQGIFRQEAKISCTGRRPWLLDERDQKEECSEQMSVSQRNSKSIWSPETITSIFIPPWENTLSREIDPTILELIFRKETPEERLNAISMGLDLINEKSNKTFTVDELAERIENEIQNTQDADPILKNDEYKAFTDSKSIVNHLDFEIISQQVPKTAQNFLNKIISVPKLKETRALFGFTRQKNHSATGDENFRVDLSRHKLSWLPAIEVFGEGIFFEINSDVIDDFIQSKDANIDFQKIRNDLSNEEKKYIFLHSFSHVLIKGLAIEAGYSISSIKERIYSKPTQSGVLLYTSSSDSEGTLGGLCRLAETHRIESILNFALLSSSRCSNDPLCGNGFLSETDPENGSVCHSCLLLPETTCEDFNSNLTRVLIELFLENYLG